MQILVAALLVYFLFLAILFIFQRRFFYHPFPLYQAPGPLGFIYFQEIMVETADDLNLHGWYSPAQIGKRTIVFTHGNASHLALQGWLAKKFVVAGYGFLFVEYRGYSGNPGRPSEQGLYADARAFINWLQAQGVLLADIVLWGHSLGTGIAVQMATEFPVGGLILETPFTSMARVAQKHLPIAPIWLLLRDRYNNLAKIKNLKMPLLLFHGDKDGIVPMRHGQQLFEAMTGHKIARFVPGANHINLHEYRMHEDILYWLDHDFPSAIPAKAGI